MVGEDWEAGIAKALTMDGAAARSRIEERYSVNAVFPRWWDVIRSAIAL